MLWTTSVYLPLVAQLTTRQFHAHVIFTSLLYWWCQTGTVFFKNQHKHWLPLGQSFLNFISCSDAVICCLLQERRVHIIVDGFVHLQWYHVREVACGLVGVGNYRLCDGFVACNTVLQPSSAFAVPPEVIVQALQQPSAEVLIHSRLVCTSAYYCKLFCCLCHFSQSFYIMASLATGYATQHKSVPVPSQDKLGGLWQEGHSA